MGGELPVILPAKAAEKAACWLLPDRSVTMETVPQRRHEATADRCRGESLVLAIQDTTTLNYSALEATEGLGKPGGGGKGSTGILAHAGLAVTAEGRPLGLFTIDADLRDDPEKDSQRWLDGLDRARGLAAACPDTRVVSVRHREGGFRRMPGRAAGHGDAPRVRASRSVRQRVRTEGGEDVCLWEHAASLPALAAVDLTVPASGGPRARRERTARPGIRAAEAAVLPPKRGCGTEPLTMFAVSATGTDVDDGEEPLHWLPLTNGWPAEGQPDSMRALTVLDWYRGRWTGGTWFRTLRSGTGGRDRRLDTADGPPRRLASGAVTACRVAGITMLARERPDTPATEACPEEDIRLPPTLLSAQGHREVTTMADGKPPDIRTFVIDLGRPVGAHSTKRQPLPGVKKVWQGLL